MGPPVQTPIRLGGPATVKPWQSFGGADRDRTDDLVIANDALSQLSYCPSSEQDFARNRGCVKHAARDVSARQGGAFLPLPRLSLPHLAQRHGLAALGMFDHIARIITARPALDPLFLALFKIGVGHIPHADKGAGLNGRHHRPSKRQGKPSKGHRQQGVFHSRLLFYKPYRKPSADSAPP